MNALAFAYKLWTNYEALARLAPESNKIAPQSHSTERRVRRRSSPHLRELTREPEVQDGDGVSPDARRDASEGRGNRG
ncbi:MAG: hypothetical protein QM784_14745 [Polyangiaceae bacterium]